MNAKNFPRLIFLALLIAVLCIVFLAIHTANNRAEARKNLYDLTHYRPISFTKQAEAKREADERKREFDKWLRDTLSSTNEP